jgi:hypothetical protein
MPEKRNHNRPAPQARSASRNRQACRPRQPEAPSVKPMERRRSKVDVLRPEEANVSSKGNKSSKIIEMVPRCHDSNLRKM